MSEKDAQMLKEIAAHKNINFQKQFDKLQEVMNEELGKAFKAIQLDIKSLMYDMDKDKSVTPEEMDKFIKYLEECIGKFNKDISENMKKQMDSQKKFF